MNYKKGYKFEYDDEFQFLTIWCMNCGVDFQNISATDEVLRWAPGSCWGCVNGWRCNVCACGANPCVKHYVKLTVTKN